MGRGVCAQFIFDHTIRTSIKKNENREGVACVGRNYRCISLSLLNYYVSSHFCFIFVQQKKRSTFVMNIMRMVIRKIITDIKNYVAELMMEIPSWVAA